MGIFTRFRDIVNSNINSMLESAEDPEKLVKLMIMEMEDTLVEIKSNAAAAMASRQKIQRALSTSRTCAEDWGKKAQLAVDKGREDLAREALLEKRYCQKNADVQERELGEFDILVEQYKTDIQQLEVKLTEVRDKHRVLVQRHIHGQGKKRLQKQIRKVESADSFARFEKIESRVDRIESEAELVNFGRKPGLEEEFLALQENDEIEQELNKLKNASAKN